MEPLHRTAVLLWTVLFIVVSLVHAQREPEHTVSYFQNLPTRLFFFEDQTDVVYFDASAGNLYNSHDEGKSWARAKDIPEGKAAMIIEHPFDNSLAFVLTKGTTHYRTDDRGKTWKSFDMPIPPAQVGRPLSFHSGRKKWEYVLYQGIVCESTGLWPAVCHDETYYTKDGFASEAQLLLTETSRCQFAHSSKEFKHEAHEDLIYCVAFEGPSSSDGVHSLASSRLFSSDDFFKSNKRIEDLGLGKNSRGIVALAIVSKFAVVAMRDLSPGNNGDMLLYVTVDTKSWAKAQFPHATSAKLRENAYTIVESTTHSLAVDVVLQDQSTVGTLFVSNSNGTFFVESLKDTNRNAMGFVDYENLYGIEGVGLANIVANAKEVEIGRESKKLRSRITYDDGRSWSRLMPPSHDNGGHRIGCNPADGDCALHLHSVTLPHNFGRVFSSPAPGLVMGVGSVGEYLKQYEECDTFLSTDAGVTWQMIRSDAHKYEFGDSGSILVVINDEDTTDEVHYSTDFGKTWKKYQIGVKLRAKALTTVPDSTSQKFFIVGQISRRDEVDGRGRIAVVFLDFTNTRGRQCQDDDFDSWYARSAGHECVMGHKQYYKRRKASADCYVGSKFLDPVEHEENCPCADEDYECDYNFIRQGDKCVPAGPEPIPAGVCLPDDAGGTFMGSSGYRLIPGNTCDKSKGKTKDTKVEKSCSEAQPAEGQIIHQTFEFPSAIRQFAYFKNSRTILMRLEDGTVWQSSNEGYTWYQILAGENVKIAAFYHHTYSNDRAYLVTYTDRAWYTTDTGRTWNPLSAPLPPNSLGIMILRFHPDKTEYLIWTGSRGCESTFEGNCHTEAHYSLDNGRTWDEIDKYVHNCAWARDSQLHADSRQILCESYAVKEGDQRFFGLLNPLQLISGADFYAKRTKVFDHVVGFAKFSEFLIVAEYQTARQSLDLQVSLDGINYSQGQFPPAVRLDQHAYTILESSTNSVFLHVTIQEPPGPAWGDILKSNSNGTYFGVSVENVHRNDKGYIDFEKMIGLDGIALINIVANPHEATITGKADIQSRITHNDGGTWKPLHPPEVDSRGNEYECKTVGCSLHIHGYTERYDARATYSTPSVPGLLMAVGNVGAKLALYEESDTFLSRDAGFTWEEVHKDAHLWEFGDSGSILVMVNDEQATDQVMYSLDEGLTWKMYQFTNDKIRVREIVTVPEDTSRRFILIGYNPLSPFTSVAVHLDFSALTRKECVLDTEDPNHDDFELWSPSEERAEKCLFGRQTLYHRRQRKANCVVGSQEKYQAKVVQNCPCTEADFECEFNHRRDSDGKCVLVNGTSPRPPDDSCRNDEEFWYERTAYQRIPYSTCKDGIRLDRGTEHRCPGIKGHGFFFWFFVLIVPSALAALVGYWFYRRSGLARGTIRLPGSDGPRYVSRDSGALSTLASVPWFLIGLSTMAYEWMASRFDTYRTRYRARRGYRHVPVDEDAQVLRFEDEE